MDYGNRRVGLAMSDPLQIIATPLPTLTIKGMAEAVDHIRLLDTEHTFEKIIVGYPVGLNGQKTEQTKVVETFIGLLRTVVTCSVLPWDERFSSREATQILVQKGIRTGHNKGKIDEMAARILLQEYLDSK